MGIWKNFLGGEKLFTFIIDRSYQVAGLIFFPKTIKKPPRIS